MNTSVNVYASAIAKPTEAARLACDAWRAACETYKNNPCLANSDAVTHTREAWQKALERQGNEADAFHEWRLVRKHNRGTQS